MARRWACSLVIYTFIAIWRLTSWEWCCTSSRTHSITPMVNSRALLNKAAARGVRSGPKTRTQRHPVATYGARTEAPRDLVQTAGARNCHGYVVPSLDLVFVRLGDGRRLHRGGQDQGGSARNHCCGEGKPPCTSIHISPLGWGRGPPPPWARYRVSRGAVKACTRAAEINAHHKNNRQ